MDTQNHSSQEQPKQNTIAKQKKSIGRYSKLIVVGLLIITLVGVEFGVWKGTHFGSVWRTISLKISTTSWKRSFGHSKIEKQIQSQLQEMSTFLASGDTTSALQYVHPDQKEKYTRDFASYPERIPALIEGLRSAKVVFISPKSNTYDTERMARVELQIPHNANAPSDDTSSFSTTLTCILLEERWVIDS